MNLEIQKYISDILAISKKLLYFLAFILLIVNTLDLQAQYSIDSNAISYKIDSTKLKDSIRKYTIAHVDTSFYNVDENFHPKNLFDDLAIGDIQIQSPHINYKFSWLLILLLICLVAITFVKIFYQSYFSSLIKNIFTFQVSINTRDIFSLNTLGSLLLNIVFIITLSISLYFIILYFNPQIHNKTATFFLILLVFTIYYILRISVLYFMKSILTTGSALDIYIKNISWVNQFLSMCLLFILFIYLTGAKSYDGFIIYILLFIIIIAQLTKYVKGLVSNIQQITNNFFHFIIYICTLEIAPLIIIYKLFISHV